ncbi:MAG: DNA-processing protein DprA [Acidimicrobiales bacterium]
MTAGAGMEPDTPGLHWERGAAAALAALPGIGPASLRGLLDAAASPAAAWAAVRDGHLRRPEGRSSGRGIPWTVAAAGVDVAERAASLRRADVGVTWLGGPDYPSRLAGDEQAPGVLFWRGSLDGLQRQCVAVVGTRRCTPDGRVVAAELGRDLAEAGVCVVSGLALGIDGAAQRGAVDSGRPGATVGVAGGGVDVPYPRSHARLWEDVVAIGAIVSEAAPGVPAQSWRFPVRNRVIAGLADLIVVVESHAGGGSLLTVDAALARGTEVRVVPGPVHSPASAGTNRLLMEGAGPVRSAADVLDALGDFRPSPPMDGRPRRRLAAPLPPVVAGAGAPASHSPRASASIAPLHPTTEAVLDAVGWRPMTLNTVVLGCGLGLAAVTAALDDLVERGLVAQERGWWQRRR